MTALQELMIGLSPFTRSRPLSNLRWSSGLVFRRHCHAPIHSSSSPSFTHFSLPVTNSLISPEEFRFRHFATKRQQDHLKLGAANRGNCEPSTTENSLADTEITNDYDNSSPISAASGSTGDTKLRTESAEAEDWYVYYIEKDEPTNAGNAAKAVPAVDYLRMTDKQLFAKCRMDTYRASGPGGQHRNKTDSAVRLTHIPTGLVSQSADDRSQHINRSLALTRLRQFIALEVRDPVDLVGYKPPPELVTMLPSGTGGKRGNSQRIGPNHPDFVLGMKALMDLLYAIGGSISDAGKVLGISTGALSKLVTSNNLLWQGVNKLRALKGLKPLR